MFRTELRTTVPYIDSGRLALLLVKKIERNSVVGGQQVMASNFQLTVQDTMDAPPTAHPCSDKLPRDSAVRLTFVPLSWCLFFHKLV